MSSSRLKFYTDTHIPKAVAVQLRSKGVDVVRCEEVGLAEADDAEHLEYAAAQGRTLVTHDLEFWTYHSEWLSQELRHAGIVLISNQLQGNIGRIVTELFDLHRMIAEGAGTLEEDLYSKVYEIKR